MSLTFVNSTAQYAGSGLYGGTIDCFWHAYQRFKIVLENSILLVTTFFLKLLMQCSIFVSKLVTFLYHLTCIEYPYICSGSG